MQQVELDGVLSCLDVGEDNATTTKTLMQRTGLDLRTLRQAIRELRLQGVLICSRTRSPGGYWLADGQMELQTFVRSMTNRGKAVFAAASPARRASRE